MSQALIDAVTENNEEKFRAALYDSISYSQERVYNSENYNALHLAVKHNRISFIKDLVRKGFSIFLLANHAFSYENALTLASQADNWKQLVGVLLEKFDPYEQGELIAKNKTYLQDCLNRLLDELELSDFNVVSTLLHIGYINGNSIFEINPRQQEKIEGLGLDWLFLFQVCEVNCDDYCINAKLQNADYSEINEQAVNHIIGLLDVPRLHASSRFEVDYEWLLASSLKEGFYDRANFLIRKGVKLSAVIDLCEDHRFETGNLANCLLQAVRDSNSQSILYILSSPAILDYFYDPEKKCIDNCLLIEILNSAIDQETKNVAINAIVDGWKSQYLIAEDTFYLILENTPADLAVKFLNNLKNNDSFSIDANTSDVIANLLTNFAKNAQVCIALKDLAEAGKLTNWQLPSNISEQYSQTLKKVDSNNETKLNFFIEALELSPFTSDDHNHILAAINNHHDYYYGASYFWTVLISQIDNLNLNDKGSRKTADRCLRFIDEAECYTHEVFCSDASIDRTLEELVVLSLKLGHNQLANKIIDSTSNHELKEQLLTSMLFSAIESRESDKVKFALDLGANPNSKKYSKTPMKYAMQLDKNDQWQDNDIVMMLLQHDAEADFTWLPFVDREDNYIFGDDPVSRRVWQYASNYVEQVIPKGKSFSENQARQIGPILHAICYKEVEDAENKLNFFLQRGIEVNEKDRNQTPLTKLINQMTNYVTDTGYWNRSYYTSYQWELVESLLDKKAEFSFYALINFIKAHLEKDEADKVARLLDLIPGGHPQYTDIFSNLLPHALARMAFEIENNTYYIRSLTDAPVFSVNYVLDKGVDISTQLMDPTKDESKLNDDERTELASTTILSALLQMHLSVIDELVKSSAPRRATAKLDKKRDAFCHNMITIFNKTDSKSVSKLLGKQALIAIHNRIASLVKARSSLDIDKEWDVVRTYIDWADESDLTENLLDMLFTLAKVQTRAGDAKYFEEKIKQRQKSLSPNMSNVSQNTDACSNTSSETTALKSKLSQLESRHVDFSGQQGRQLQSLEREVEQLKVEIQEANTRNLAAIDKLKHNSSNTFDEIKAELAETTNQNTVIDELSQRIEQASSLLNVFSKTVNTLKATDKKNSEEVAKLSGHLQDLQNKLASLSETMVADLHSLKSNDEERSKIIGQLQEQVLTQGVTISKQDERIVAINEQVNRLTVMIETLHSMGKSVLAGGVLTAITHLCLSLDVGTTLVLFGSLCAADQRLKLTDGFTLFPQQNIEKEEAASVALASNNK